METNVWNFFQSGHNVLETAEHFGLSIEEVYVILKAEAALQREGK